MNGRLSILLLASLIALGSIIAGCTNTSDATSASSAPPTVQTPPDDAGNVTAGNTRFAFDLYRQIASAPAYTGKNIFFSPYSISSALAITYEGARGTTADEIRSVLHLPANETLRRTGFAGIDADLARGDENYTLRTATPSGPRRHTRSSRS
ncbi:MAG TPA: serpin family protein, partial [Methanoculleus sp.]|nr:serpin family protein [Methanoculleus sp.]